MDLNRLQQLGAERAALLERLEAIRAEADPGIAALRAAGTPQKDLATAYRVDRDAIRLIVKRQSGAAG